MAFVAVIILFCQRLGQISMVLIRSDLLVKNYGRLYQKKSKSPNHQKYLKELLSPSKLWTAAANCANTFSKSRFFVISIFYYLYILYS